MLGKKSTHTEAEKFEVYGDMNMFMHIHPIHVGHIGLSPVWLNESKIQVLFSLALLMEEF